MTRPAGAAGPVAVEVLRGPDHPTLDARAVRSVGPAAAIALSAGRHPKAVPALDANEDAAVGVVGPAATVAAVADGHVGADAALAAVDAVASGGARLAAGTAGEARRAMIALAEEAGQAVAAARAVAVGDRSDSATALSVVALVGRTAWTVTYGDTAVVRIRGQRARLVSRTAPFLVGAGPTPKPRRERLRPGDHVVAASDGVIEHLGRDWPVEVARRVAQATSPAEAADAVVAAAMDGAAGDHLSCAVVRAG